MRVFILHSDEQIYYNSARLMSSYFDTIVCVSGHIENRLTTEDPYLKEKTAVIHYGVEVPAKMPEKNPDDPITVLYSGRLIEYQKRVSRLAEIVLQLDRITKDYKFIFVGDGSCWDILKGKLKNQIESGNVIFTGRLLRSEINKYTASSDIFVLTSDFEGTPLALLEAMAHGCVPVVNRTESGIPEVVEEGVNGYIIEECNISDFVSRITELKKNRAKLKELSENAFRKATKEYSTQIMGNRFLNLFDRFFSADIQKSTPKEFSSDTFACLLPWLNEEKASSLLRCFDRVAIFGCGASGLATFRFLNEQFSGKCVLFIDDNYKGFFHGTEVVTTKVFLAEREKDVDIIAFGAYQKVNHELLQNTIKPHIKLDNIV